MRGFVITLTSVGLIAMLVILAISLRNAQFATERALMEPLPLIYSSFILDDIAYEFNSLVGPSIWINKDNDSTLIAVSDTLHDENHSAVISAYGAFLAGEVSSRTSSDISANFSNLTGGTMRLFINEDYVYSNSYQANESLFTKPGGTGASSYEINLTVTAVRRAVSHMEFVENGSMNVTIRYTDLNGTAIEEGEVSPDQHNTFSLDYGDGRALDIEIGPQGGDSGSFLMKASGISAESSWAVLLPRTDASKRVGYAYDATVRYAQGKVTKLGRIGK
jgi:hypothetical protein